MNKDAEGRWKVGMSNIKLKMRVNRLMKEHGELASRHKSLEKGFVAQMYAS